MCILATKTVLIKRLEVYLLSLQTRSFNLTPLMEDPQNLQGKSHLRVPAAVNLVQLEESCLSCLFFSHFNLCGAKVFYALVLI